MIKIYIIFIYIYILIRICEFVNFIFFISFTFVNFMDILCSKEKLMTISQRIFSILEEKHLSQKDLSDYSGISPAAISSWKSKGTNPSSDKIIKISEFLNVSPTFLLTGESVPLFEYSKEVPICADIPINYQPPLPSDEIKLLEKYRTLSEVEKGRILAIIETFLNN